MACSVKSMNSAARLKPQILRRALRRFWKKGNLHLEVDAKLQAKLSATLFTASQVDALLFTRSGFIASQSLRCAGLHFVVYAERVYCFAKFTLRGLV